MSLELSTPIFTFVPRVRVAPCERKGQTELTKRQQGDRRGRRGDEPLAPLATKRERELSRLSSHFITNIHPRLFCTISQS
eukprot:scaffold227_cov165-Amphora_coffeaeformis.AAC.44